MSKNEMIVDDNVGGMGEIAYDVNMNLVSNLSNVENVHLQCGNNLSKDDDVQLKFYNGNHIVGHQIVGASLLSMTT
jgi:hypothetical protein